MNYFDYIAVKSSIERSSERQKYQDLIDNKNFDITYKLIKIIVEIWKIKSIILILNFELFKILNNQNLSKT